jgi:serine/threonine protein kinase/Tol biopolymer transport system component
MDSQRWQQIEDLYHLARALEPNQRVSWLTEACAGNEEIREDVLSLLESSDTADSFLEEPAVSLGLTVLGLEQDNLVGSTIGRYKIIETLGRGGMGEVYLAEDPRLGRRVALKLLPHSITNNDERVRRFNLEARAASAISHPNVAHIYEIAESERGHFITMEYVKGRTLRQALREKSLDTNQTFDIASQVLAGLGAAHRAGVIHRDIKPENVVLANNDYVKVLDFGLAKLIETTYSPVDSQALSSFHTGPELYMGTSHYMSPEQVRRQPVDLRTDLWSAGVVIYEMLTLGRPFHGECFSEVIVAIIEKEPAFTGAGGSQLSPAIMAFLSRALQKSADDRYQTAEEMLNDLRHLQRQIAPADHSSPVVVSDPETEPGHAGTSSSTVSEPRPTVADPIRPQTLSQRFDTAPDDSPVRLQAFASAGDILANRWFQLAVVILIVIGLGAYYASRKHPVTLAESALGPPQFERLTLSGSISDIILSPDGKYVGYVAKEGGKDTIHISELSTTSDLRIAAASNEGYSGLSFSPDGTYVYYLQNQAEAGTLYRVSKLGGGQRKILENVNTRVTFSPDGGRIAFVRSNHNGEPADLITSQSDGTDPRVLVKRTRSETDFFLSDVHGAGPAWSPDGARLACPTFSLARNQEMKTNLEIVDVERGGAQRINKKSWAGISRVVWLADGSGLVVATQETAGAAWQLELIAYPGGEVRKLTNDPNNYTLASSSRDSKLFVTLNSEEDVSVWRLSLTDRAAGETLDVSQASGISEIDWGGNGKVIYTISDGTHLNLWEKSESSAPKRLTFEADNSKPIQSRDGQYIVFVSTRAGKMNIWRMDSDGTHPLQLTRGVYEDVPSLTPDNKWVVYRTGNAIMKVSMDGGEPIRLITKSALCPAVSPDGRSLSFFTNDRPDSQEWHIEVYDLDSIALIKRFELPSNTTPFNNLRLTPDNRLRWTPDSQNLSYTSHADGVSNVWLQPLKDGGPRQLTHFKDAEISSFSWAPDAKQLSCVRNVKAYVPVLVRLF